MTKPAITKARKILGYVMLSLCAAILLYCAAVMIYRLATVSSARRMAAFVRFLAEFGITCVLALPALDVRFGLFSWRKNRAVWVAGNAVRVLYGGFTLVFAVLIAAICIFGAMHDDKPVQSVCLLGLAIDGDELPRDLVYRLDTALDYSATHPDTLFVATGGNDQDPARTEAARMVAYLEAHGMTAEDGKLIAETEARTTIENFEKVAAYVDKHAAVGVITNDYHLFRATRIAKKQGYVETVKIPAPSVALLYPENVMWEGICTFFSTLGGHLAY